MSSMLKIVSVASATLVVMMTGSSLRLVDAIAPPDQQTARAESSTVLALFVPEPTEPPPVSQGSGTR
jgi:hypothetical protein